MSIFKMPRETKLNLAANIQHYFEMELNEEIGQLAAENLLDFMLKELTPLIYNQAIADARQVITQQAGTMEEELYALEKPLTLSNRK